MLMEENNFLLSVKLIKKGVIWMNEQKGANMSDFGQINDNMMEADSDKTSVSIKTNVDPKNVLEDNPYFDKTKTYSKKELEKFKKFFRG